MLLDQTAHAPTCLALDRVDLLQDFAPHTKTS
jgi:hypothetical protein